MSELASFLREARANKNLTLREAARRAGIAHSRLFDLEHGISSKTNKPVVPTRKNLEGLSKAYDVDFEILVVKAMHLGADKSLGDLSINEMRIIKLWRALSPAKQMLWLSVGEGLKALPGE